MEYVLDGSFALAWVLPDETSPDADRFVDRLTLHDVLWVPTLWRYEVSNGLAMAQRRRRLAEVDRFRAIALLAKLPIRTEAQVGAVAIRRLSALALATGLYAYDAAYLDLAVQKGRSDWRRAIDNFGRKPAMLASQLSKLEPTSPITLTSPPM